MAKDVPVRREAFFALCRDLEAEHDSLMKQYRGESIWLKDLSPEQQFQRAVEEGFKTVDVFYMKVHETSQ